MLLHSFLPPSASTKLPLHCMLFGGFGSSTLLPKYTTSCLKGQSAPDLFLLAFAPSASLRSNSALLTAKARRTPSLPSFFPSRSWRLCGSFQSNRSGSTSRPARKPSSSRRVRLPHGQRQLCQHAATRAYRRPRDRAGVAALIANSRIPILARHLPTGQINGKLYAPGVAGKGMRGALRDL